MSPAEPGRSGEGLAESLRSLRTRARLSQTAAAERASLPLVAIAADASALPPEVRSELGESPDVVVVNPPRKGLTPAARELVIALGARCAIYVSCGPEALGRDLIALAEQGWHPDVIEPFDLMPGTGQIETVVRLRRS